MARLDRLAAAKRWRSPAPSSDGSLPMLCCAPWRGWRRRRCSTSWRDSWKPNCSTSGAMPPQATYIFKHALIQDAAYQSLLKSTRQQYHQRIAQVLDAHFPQAVETQPELLAHHYTKAGFAESGHSRLATGRPARDPGSAIVEAIAHFTRALDVLQTLPETPRARVAGVASQLTLGGRCRLSRALRPRKRNTLCAGPGAVPAGGG